MLNTNQIFRNLTAAMMSLFMTVGCSKDFKSKNGISPSSTSLDVNPWSQGIPGPLASSEPYGSQPQPSGPYCAIYVPANIINRNQEFRIVVLSKEVVRVEVSVNNNNYVSLGTNYGELKWPGNTFDSGEYNLIFRGISSSGGIISCDPSSKQVIIQNTNPTPTPVPAPVPPSPSPNPAPAPSPNPDPTNQKAEYSPLVKLGYSGYKDVYNPTAVTYYEGNAILSTSHADVTLSKIKFFVPPGTKKFTVSFLTYASSTEAKVAARFNALPLSTASDVTDTTSVRQTQDTLQRLLAGEELRFYSPGGSGALGISAPYQFDTFQTDKGGYIYLHVLSVPGNKIYTLKTIMDVSEPCYRSWYANAKWDAQGNPDENAIHTCSGSTGFLNGTH